MDARLDETLVNFEEEIKKISTKDITKISEDMQEAVMKINSFERGICEKISETTKFAILLNNDDLKEECSKNYGGANIYKLRNEDGTIKQTFAINHQGLCFKGYHQPYASSFNRDNLKTIVITPQLEKIVCDKLNSKDLFEALKNINNLLDTRLKKDNTNYNKTIKINLSLIEKVMFEENANISFDIINARFINEYRTYGLNYLPLSDVFNIKYLILFHNHKKEIMEQVKTTHDIIKKDLNELNSLEEEIDKQLSKWLILSRMGEEQ